MEWVGFAGLVAAATISGTFAVLAGRFRRDSTAQHHENHVRLGAIGEDVVEIRSDLREVRRSQGDHLQWHAEQGAA